MTHISLEDGARLTGNSYRKRPVFASTDGAQSPRLQANVIIHGRWEPPDPDCPVLVTYRCRPVGDSKLVVVVLPYRRR